MTDLNERKPGDEVIGDPTNVSITVGKTDKTVWIKIDDPYVWPELTGGISPAQARQLAADLLHFASLAESEDNE